MYGYVYVGPTATGVVVVALVAFVVVVFVVLVAFAVVVFVVLAVVALLDVVVFVVFYNTLK